MVDQKNYKDIEYQINELLDKEQMLLVDLKNVEINLYNVKHKIREIMKKFPSCHSCGTHQNPKNMIIATQQDVDKYYDQNDGYCGPEIGEYYCGC